MFPFMKKVDPGNVIIFVAVVVLIFVFLSLSYKKQEKRNIKISVGKVEILYPSLDEHTTKRPTGVRN